jgi:hypothetical protein
MQPAQDIPGSRALAKCRVKSDRAADRRAGQNGRMPWTFSHPAAVLPLRRFAPRYLSLPALMCGSIAPDVGYYLGRFDVAAYAHTAAGSVVAGVPIALACLLLFYLLRRPLWFLLPHPHRSAVAPLIKSTPWRQKSFWFAAVPSLLIGVWTHNIWDSFTHLSGWMVERVPLLQEAVLRLGGKVWPVHHLLQHLSTVVGAAALAIAYVSWLRRQPRAQLAFSDPGDLTRYIAVLAAAVVSVAVAFPVAHRASHLFRPHLSYEILIVQLAIHASTVLAVIVLLYSAVYAIVARNR